MSARAALPTVAPARRLGVASASVRVGIEVAALTAVFALAVAVRLVGLGDPTDVSDEGIRGIQLRLLAAGFKPVAEIYASQGPLSLWLFAPSVWLFGPDIVVGRLTSVAASLVALLGTAWLARRLAGAVAGVGAALVMALAPVYLDSSRLAFVEAPSLAPTVLALAALLQYRGDGRRRWIVASACLLAVGALAKPMAAVAGLPALVLLLAPRRVASGDDAGARAIGQRANLADLVLFAATGLLVCTVAVAAIGPVQLYEQVVAYRLGARAARGWDPAANGRIVLDHLRLNGWGVSLAVALGLVAALGRRSALGLAVVAWLGAALTALLIYSPLWPKHVTYAIPPLAILAGAGFGALGRLVERPVRVGAVAGGVGALLALALVAWQLPQLRDQTRSILYRHAGDDLARYADDLQLVQALTAPDDFVVIDDAYVAMLTGRLTPPPLADLSWNRILARALTAEQAIAETRRFNARVLILQDDHLGQVQRYLAWADREYVLVKSYVQRRPAKFRRIYAAPDGDLGAARATSLASLDSPTDARLGPAALLAYELEARTIKLGSRVDLTLMFEALQDRPPEHALILRLQQPGGGVAWEGQWKVGDGGQELHTWKRGGWQVQTLRLLVDDVPPGVYHLTVALQRPNGGPASVQVGRGATAWAGGEALDLGQVTVGR